MKAEQECGTVLDIDVHGENEAGGAERKGMSGSGGGHGWHHRCRSRDRLPEVQECVKVGRV